MVGVEEGSYAESRWTLKWVLSLLRKLSRDSAVRTSEGSSFHHPFSYWSVLSIHHSSLPTGTNHSLLIGQSSVVISFFSPYKWLRHQRDTEEDNIEGYFSPYSSSSIREKWPISISNLSKVCLAMISIVFQHSKNATLSWIHMYSINHLGIVNTNRTTWMLVKRCLLTF